MARVKCPECGTELSARVSICPECGYQLNPPQRHRRLVRPYRWGFEWKSKITLLGLPLVHIAIGRNKQTGKLMAAKGIIAIGQFAIGLITFAQFGIGLLFGVGQFVGGMFCVGQAAFGVFFGLGQVAAGMTAIGQMAFGDYVRAQVGIGNHVWSSNARDPQAVGYFSNLWQSARNLDLWQVIKAIMDI